MMAAKEEHQAQSQRRYLKAQESLRVWNGRLNRLELPVVENSRRIRTQRSLLQGP